MPFLLVLLAWPGSAVAAAWHVHPSPPAASHATEHDHGTAGHDEAGGHDHGTAEPGGTEPGSELGADHNGEHSTGAGQGRAPWA